MPRPFTLDDGPALVDLSESIGWRHTVQDWRTLLASGAVFGDRDQSGRIVSSAGIFPYGAELASIGVVVVREEARRRGLARRAMECSLETHPGPVMLVATAEGRPLYESQGFRAVEEIVTLVAPAGTSLPPGAARPMDDASLPVALALDREAYAADRGRMLRARWRQAEGGSVIEDGSGFARKVAQRDVLVLGPVIAEDEAGAAALVGDLARGRSGRLRIDIPRLAIAQDGASAGCGLHASRHPPADAARRRSSFGPSMNLFNVNSPSPRLRCAGRGRFSS